MWNSHITSKRLAAFAHDCFAIPVAWILAYWLRYNMGEIPVPVIHSIALPIVITIQASIYWAFGLYRGIWRFASIPDLIRIVKAVFSGCALIVLALFLTTRMNNVPRSVIPLYGLMLLLILSGSRMLYRWLKDQNYHGKMGQRILIIGAGQAAEGLIRGMRREDSLLHPIAILDDDKNKQGFDIQGVRVLGKIEKLGKICQSYNIQLIVIAIPTAPAAQMRRIVELCDASKIAYQTLPGLNDIASGKVSINQLREVKLEDLLGRDPVKLDWQGIRGAMENKTILVTGAGGSIGSELCRQIAGVNPKKLIMLDQNEFGLFNIERELNSLDVAVELADVTDKVAMEHVMVTHKPQVIFHAAAYKHVPMLENQVRVALNNNLIGTQVVANLASQHYVERFILISTDKVVNPHSVMGLSKRAAEIFCQNFNRKSVTRFITVRFGNVLGSSGSVVPLFKEQILNGGPVTVTHADITRFFMTIPEATQLILQAATMGEGGEIFVLDMGEPIKIAYLAEKMIQLAGHKVGQDIKIEYTGLRPGEKLHEELFHDQEALRHTSHAKVLMASHRHVSWEDLTQALRSITMACERYDERELLSLLQKMVPEYKTVMAPVEMMNEEGVSI